ncbi:MAG: hypothetical protein IT578_08925 [Verrucomicrobiae bacterium]|nr:hypothetical protein [Verrucomicrobiae bacterium]
MKPHFAEMLFAWGRRLAACGARGCLAYRFALGYVATARGADLAKLSRKDLVFLAPEQPGSEVWTAKGEGKAPDAWWVLAVAFEDRGSAVFCFLVEGEGWAAAAVRAGRPAVEGAGGLPEASTIAALEAALGQGNLVSLRGIGALALGSTADDAGLALTEIGKPS